MDLSVVQLVPFRTLADTPGVPADLIMAVRWKVACLRKGADPIPRLIDRLGRGARAGRAVSIVRLIGAIWPDPFMLSPPCCRRLSFDEALLCDLAAAAAAGDRGGFDRHACDLLNDHARGRLWRELAAFSD